MTDGTNYLKQLLNERVKELRCLFEISKICQQYDADLTSTLKKIVAQIPEGWQFPDRLEVYFRLDSIEFGEKVNNRSSQQTDIIVNGEIRGEIAVYYPDVDASLFSFLDEEVDLLNQIGIETASFIERMEQREKDKKIAEVLRGNDRLNILGELTAGIAHELNTPLGNILGYAELLMKSERDATKKGDIQKILSSAKNAREIVKRLMYFSCEMPQQFSYANMNDLIRENIGFLQKQLLENEVLLRLELDEKIPPIRLDSVQFSQILFNLILNAINAVEKGGEIHVKTERLQTEVQLQIIDNGRGISKEDQSRIFQPFFTTKPKGEGTGLGLSVVHGIVNAHNGKISVQSNEGMGTIFTLAFPINIHAHD